MVFQIQIQIQIQIFAYLNTNTNTNTYLTPALAISYLSGLHFRVQMLIYIFLSVLRVKYTVCDNSAVECMAEDALKYLSLNVDERLTLDSPKVSQLCICISHDDIIKWKHFPCNCSFVRGIHRSLVNSLHKGQWCGALMFSLICSWINGWVNNGEAGDLRCHHVHYDVTVMCITHWPLGAVNVMLKVLFSKSFF